VQDIDVIAHAAAWTSLLNHRKESDAWFLKPSLELIEQAKHAGVSRFIFMSTNSAASPETSSDATSPGIERKYWPHLCNVVKIEDRLREVADKNFCVVNLRLGLFAGKRYNLGLLPILLPRLKTHLVPWVKGGKTDMPIIDGRDIGQSIALASTVKGLDGYESFNVMGPEVPTSRQVIDYLHDRHSYPRPHFGVPFPMAYMFAWLMEKLDTIVPWDPLITRSIIHILEETNSNNEQAKERLGYQPQIHWKEAIDLQVAEMNVRQTSPMHMHVNMN
jgi:nucleoside-diphosphate-sugar epimerase